MGGVNNSKKTTKKSSNTDNTDNTDNTNNTSNTNTFEELVKKLPVLPVLCIKVVAEEVFEDSINGRILKILATSDEYFTYDKIAELMGKNPANIRQAIDRQKEDFVKYKPDDKKIVIQIIQKKRDEIQLRIDNYNRKINQEASKNEEKEKENLKGEELIIESKKFFNFIKKDLGKQLKQRKGNVIINFMDLVLYSIPLSENLLCNPEETFKLLQIALEESGLVNPNEIRVRVINLPTSQNISIENLRSKHLDELIFIEGRVVSITDVRPQAVSAKFECPSCGTIISVLQIEKKFREPSRCSCGRRGGFKLISKEMVDTARIILEDLQEKTDNPHTRRLNVFIKEDLTNHYNIKMVTPGNEVKIVGVLKEIPIPLSKGGFSTRFEIAIEVNSVELSEQEIDVSKFSEEEIKEIEEVSMKIDLEGLKEINPSFAPEIYGLEEIKNAMILQLCNKRNNSINGNMRNKPNILLIGDPGSAKSVLGNFAVSITSGARKVTGGGSSAVGITASVIKEDDGWRVEPGAFVLAKDLLFIDELNNLSDEDKPKLQEAMSEQSVTIAKANIRMTMKVTAGALATANPSKGVFRDDEDLVKQFNLPAPIINRFDEIFVIRDRVDEEADKAIAKNMLNRDRGRIKPKYSKEFLKKFFVYIKQSQEPIIEDSIAEYMGEIYAKVRRYKTSSININPRLKETLIRLSKASAKIRLSETIEKKDIERAINILSKSYYNIPSYKIFEDEITKK